MTYKICLMVEQDGAWAPFKTLDEEYTSAFEATVALKSLNETTAPGERYCLVSEPGETDIVPGACYRHFKGSLYEVQTIALHSERQETLVIYKALTGSTWARPAHMWTEKVRWPDGKRRPRFSPETEELRALFQPKQP